MRFLPRRADGWAAASRGLWAAKKTWPRYSVLKMASGKCAVVEVHDGDTFKLVFVTDDEGAMGEWPWLRLAGANAWELKDPGGIEARDFTATQLDAAQSIEVELGGMSFGRRVARVFIDGVDLAGVLIAAGHAEKWPK